MSKKRIEISLKGLHALQLRLDVRQLLDEDWPIVDSLINNLILSAEERQRRMLEKIAADAAANSTNKNIIDVTPITTDPIDDQTDGDNDTTSMSMSQDEANEPPLSSPDKSDSKSKKSHGRKGAAAFINAPKIIHHLKSGIIGAICKFCFGSNVTQYREKTIIRVIGQPLFSATIHAIEQGMCRACGRIVRAEVPPTVMDGIGSSYIVYDWSACAILAVMHYTGGLPFKRIESLHAGWGVPFPDANQWNVVNAGDDLLLPLLKALEKYAIKNALTLRIDDTGSMVIELREQIKSEIAETKGAGKSINNVRTGINATCVYIDTEAGPIVLFYIGIHHAGEILDQLLKSRNSSAMKINKISDAATKNFDHNQSDKMNEGACNAHAFLKFHDIKQQFPSEYEMAGKVYGQIYTNEDVTRSQKMSPVQRLNYHKKYSLPLMEELKSMCIIKISSKLVEPRSPLWEPLTFIINQSKKLTLFCEKEGMPLDSNLVEQTLITITRYLAVSFNYKNITGAQVGDHFMTLIITARKCGVEPVAWLTYCLENHEDLAVNPEKYLPWVYRKYFTEQERPPDRVDISETELNQKTG
jgi:transposase